jgi:diguanylate cyclase (GGDEF)-like protein
MKASEPSAAATVAGAAVLVVAVAGLDWASGTELRVFPLYFLPVLAVSLRLGRWPGLATACACALAWQVSNGLAGMRGSRPIVAVANLFAMAAAFAAVALLGATQRRWLERERALSRTDVLTGLLNGRGFYEAAATEMARAARYQRPLTLAHVDLDDFEATNARFGRAAGDAVLVGAARTLRRATRSSDLVARLGGDEFVVLFPEAGRDAAEAALHKLHARLRETKTPDGAPLRASIGAVSFPQPPADVETLVHAADAVTHEVKSAGKDALRCVSRSEPA